MNPAKVSASISSSQQQQQQQQQLSPLYIPDAYRPEEFSNFVFHGNSNSLPEFQSIVGNEANAGFNYGSDREELGNLTEGEMSKLLRFTQQFGQDTSSSSGSNGDVLKAFGEMEDDKEGLKAIVKKVLYNHLHPKRVPPTSTRAVVAAAANNIESYLNVKQQLEGIPSREGYQLITPPLSPKDEWQQHQQQQQLLLLQQQQQQPSTPNLLASEASAYQQGTLNRGKHFGGLEASQACQFQQQQQVNNLKKLQPPKTEFANVLDNAQIESDDFAASCQPTAKKMKCLKPNKLPKSAILLEELAKPATAMHAKNSLKRNAHLTAEFRYRTKLNDKISKLRSLVGQRVHLSKSAVLGQSIQTILKLQKLVGQVCEENNKLREMLATRGNGDHHQQPPSNIDLSSYLSLAENLKNFVYQPSDDECSSVAMSPMLTPEQQQSPMFSPAQQQQQQYSPSFSQQHDHFGVVKFGPGHQHNEAALVMDYRREAPHGHQHHQEIDLNRIKLELEDTYIDQLIDDNINLDSPSTCFDALEMMEPF